MKHLFVVLALFAISMIANSQDTYLCGRITAFDFNNTGIDRPVEFIKLDGFIILDKEDLVIQTKRKGKEWIQLFQVDSIGEFIREGDTLSYNVWAKDSQNIPTNFRINSGEQGIWKIEYYTDKTRWNYTGMSLKRWLVDKE